MICVSSVAYGNPNVSEKILGGGLFIVRTNGVVLRHGGG